MKRAKKIIWLYQALEGVEIPLLLVGENGTTTVENCHFLSDFCQEEWKYICVHTNTAKIFIAALFVISQNWRQPYCPSVGKWTSTLRSLHPCSGMVPGVKCPEQLIWISEFLCWARKSDKKRACYVFSLYESIEYRSP